MENNLDLGSPGCLGWMGGVGGGEVLSYSWRPYPEAQALALPSCIPVYYIFFTEKATLTP